MATWWRSARPSRRSARPLGRRERRGGDRGAGHRSCRVRPPAEPVPRAIAGSSAAEIFRRLVRMNDGAGHGPCKRAVERPSTRSAKRKPLAASRRWAEAPWPARPTLPRLPAPSVYLSHRPEPARQSRRKRLAETAEWTRDFVAGIALGAGGAAVAVPRQRRGGFSLLELFGSLLGGSEGLLAALARQAERVGRPDSISSRNGLGFLLAGLRGDGGADRQHARGPGTGSPTFGSRGSRGGCTSVLGGPAARRAGTEHAALAGPAGGSRARRWKPATPSWSCWPPPTATRGEHRPAPLRPWPGRPPEFTAASEPTPAPARRSRSRSPAGVERLLLTGLDLERFAAAVTYRPSVNARIPGGPPDPRVKLPDPRIASPDP